MIAEREASSADELGRRYALEDGLGKVRDGLRVTTQLVEAGTGNRSFLAQRFVRDLTVSAPYSTSPLDAAVAMR